MEEQSITNSQKANAYENEIKQKQEIKQVGEINLAQKVEKNSPLSLLDSVVLSVTQTPKATGGDSNMPWEQYCRERLSMKGENIGCDFDQSENEKIEFPVPDMYPFITKADKTYAKTINILAEGNSGKTFTMCYWTLCYIYNVSLFNDSRCPVNNKERKGTIIFSFEESINRIKIKLKRCKQGMINNGIISKDDPHGCIKILTPYDSEFFELDENLQYTKLSQICEDFNIGWIFIDSAAAFSADNGADDFNSNGKMLQVLKPVRNL